MARKGIEEMISEIEIFIDNCKYQPLSSSKIIVPKEDLEQMVGELKLKLPNEIERCKKIMRRLIKRLFSLASFTINLSAQHAMCIF